MSAFDAGITVDVGAAIDARMSNAVPKTEANAGAPGAAMTIPRDDHQHPRLTSTTTQLSGVSGLTTLTFTRGFSREPGPTFTVTEDNILPVPDFKVRKWLRQDGGDWNSGADQTVVANQIWGAVVYGQRARALPPVNTSTLVVAGLVVATQLSMQLGAFGLYEPFLPLEAGVKFSAIIVASSQTT